MSHRDDYELILVPAYNRDYDTVEKLKVDWLDGKDFKIACVMSPYNGMYTSIRDVKKFPGSRVKFRFNKLEDFAFVDLKTGEFDGDMECLETEEVS